MKTNETDIPRRIRIDKLVPAETAIKKATDLVEELGADPRLTEAVNFLSKARMLVADVVDERAAEEPNPEP